MMIGVWAGKETIRTRVFAQARTWFRSFTEITVFSDKFYDGTCEKIQKAAYPCNITCYTLGDFAHHLDGTEWTHRWYFAQPRFLPAMARLFFSNRTADWYLFVDDDTYILKESLQRKLASKNSSEMHAIGKSYCTWDRMSANIKPERSCHPFLQGGAGVALSNGLMTVVAPHLDGCSMRFNDPDFAGSMRFAICMERIIGVDKWSYGRVIENWGGFHSSEPKNEIPSGGVTEAPASFHRMNISDFKWMDSQYYIHNGTSIIDLGLYPLVERSIPMVRENYAFRWRFGMYIRINGIEHRAKSPWRLTSTGIIQTYANGITIELVFMDGLAAEEIKPVDIRGRNGRFVYGIRRPEVRQAY